MLRMCPVRAARRWRSGEGLEPLEAGATEHTAHKRDRRAKRVPVIEDGRWNNSHDRRVPGQAVPLYSIYRSLCFTRPILYDVVGWLGCPPQSGPGWPCIRFVRVCARGGESDAQGRRTA